MSNKNHVEEKSIAIPTPRKPVQSRHGSFMILPNTHDKGFKSNIINIDENLPGVSSPVAYNHSIINPPSFSRLAVIPNCQRSNTFYNDSYAYVHEDNKIPPEGNSPRPILQSFNSSFSKPSTFSKPLRHSILFDAKLKSNESTNTIEKEHENNRVKTQSKSSLSEHYSSFSTNTSSYQCQDHDDDNVPLGTFFRRQGNQLSCEPNSTKGGIRVSPFEPIICDRNLPRQGRISPLPTTEYEAWCAQRRVRDITAVGQPSLPTHHKLPLRDEYIGCTILGKDQSAEEDMEPNFRPVSITPSDHDSAYTNIQYEGFA